MTTKTSPQTFTIVSEVRIAASPAQVWKLIGSREQLARWIPAIRLDQQKGGRIEFHFTPDERPVTRAFGEITAYDPPKRLAFTWDFDIHPIGVRTEVAIDLIPEGKETLVRLTHSGFADEEWGNEHKDGWDYFLGRLKAFGDGGDPGPDGNIRGLPHHQAVRALLSEEIGLRNEIERVAALRRKLPMLPPFKRDYALHDLAGNVVNFGELFGEKDDLLVYNFMFKPEDDLACPMCSMWIDGYNGVARHIHDKTAFAVIAKAPVEKLKAWADERGWKNIRLLSSHGTSYGTDFHGEDPDGDQIPSINVFRRTPDGIVHFYQKFAEMTEDVSRGIDLLSPVWNLFDLLPGGRGDDWYPKHRY